MLDGALILWFVLTGFSLIYLVYDLTVNTPALLLMKIGWFLVTMYLGPFGLFIYLISCRQPFPDTHEQFIKPTWKQAVGSEVHCLAGDATGIIVAAIVISFFPVGMGWEALIEYLAGFAFGLFIFQALFMRKMVGSYWKALKGTFMSEWLSMNLIMAAMIPTITIWRRLDPSSESTTSLSFWGSLALASVIAFVVAFPINYWLVKTGQKHGMMSVKPKMPAEQPMSMGDHAEHAATKVSAWTLTCVTCVTLVILAAGVAFGFFV
jgi:hypothetical protein